MLEPEIAFGDVNDDMDLAEDYLKFIIQYTLDNNKDDLEFFDERIKKGIIEYL
jgi:asparaginyl-tRNA synthetase